MRLTCHPEAEAELVEAAEFYESRAPGLGERSHRALLYELRILVVRHHGRHPDSWRPRLGD